MHVHSTRVHTFVCEPTYVILCVCVRTCVRAYVCLYIYTHVCMYIHFYMHFYVHSLVYEHKRVSRGSTPKKGGYDPMDPFFFLAPPAGRQRSFSNADSSVRRLASTFHLIG